MNSFLQMLDGFRGESVIVAATNHQGLLDPALWRRFDDIVFFDMPNEEQAIATLVKALRQIGVEKDVNLKNSRAASGCILVPPHIEYIAIDAAKSAIRRGESHVWEAGR